MESCNLLFLKLCWIERKDGDTCLKPLHWSEWTEWDEKQCFIRISIMELFEWCFNNSLDSSMHIQMEQTNSFFEIHCNMSGHKIVYSQSCSKRTHATFNRCYHFMFNLFANEHSSESRVFLSLGCKQCVFVDAKIWRQRKKNPNYFISLTPLNNLLKLCTDIPNNKHKKK